MGPTGIYTNCCWRLSTDSDIHATGSGIRCDRVVGHLGRCSWSREAAQDQQVATLAEALEAALQDATLYRQKAEELMALVPTRTTARFRAIILCETCGHEQDSCTCV